MPTTLVPTVHSYVGVREPSSASEAVAEHVSSVLVYAFVGEMEASTSNVGGVFPMVMVAVSLTEALLLSVKVTVQVMISSGLVIPESSCKVEELPSVELVVSLVHAYIADKVPSLRSVPEAEHVSSSVTDAVEGEILTVPMVGCVFCTVAEVVVESVSPYPSSILAVHVTVSPTEAMEGVRDNDAEVPTTFVPMVHW